MSGPSAETRAALARVVAGIKAADGGAAGRVWRAMGSPTRAALVLLALEPASGSVQEQARRPWASFTDPEKLVLGSLARHLASELEHAGALR